VSRLDLPFRSKDLIEIGFFLSSMTVKEVATSNDFGANEVHSEARSL
ncbi:unnamed protein product, partial [Acidithrix sp. C25]